MEGLRRLTGVLEALSQLGIRPELWKSQNLYYQMAQNFQNDGWENIDETWKAAFLKLGIWLKVNGE
jgi:hypothetical protein